MHSSNTSIARRRTAFSLIELLVVIAIMAILASLGIPAIVKATSVAAEAKCRSNVRGIVQATTAYITDNKQVYPAKVGTNDLRFLSLVGAPGLSNWALAAPLAKDRPLYNYLNGEGGIPIAECPLDGGSSSIPNTTAANNFEYLGTSYVYPDQYGANRFGRYGVWSLEGSKLTAVQQPSKKLITTDMSLFVDPGPEQNAWHESIGNAQSASVGFVDGHVAVTAAKQDAPVYANWYNYSYTGYTYPTATQVEAWAIQDEYY